MEDMTVQFAFEAINELQYKMYETILEISNQITETKNNNTILTILAGIIIVMGVAILWNQRKIKKMLREMQKNIEKEGTEDA